MTPGLLDDLQANAHLRQAGTEGVPKVMPTKVLDFCFHYLLLFEPQRPHHFQPQKMNGLVVEARLCISPAACFVYAMMQVIARLYARHSGGKAWWRTACARPATRFGCQDDEHLGGFHGDLAVGGMTTGFGERPSVELLTTCVF